MKEIDQLSSLRVGEVARLMYVSVSTVRSWSNKGLLPSIRVGPRRDRRFSLEAVQEFMAHSPKFSL
ncbi:helix-turn-helix domain-containing protein [Candidatus Daviesbacteria bacterium]|nr:helix-turn-helix domain-containing protein [Candidatus Daviesbacteria bacterium]